MKNLNGSAALLSELIFMCVHLAILIFVLKNFVMMSKKCAASMATRGLN